MNEDTSGTLELTLSQGARVVRAVVPMKEFSDALDKGALLGSVVEHLQGCLKFNIKITDNAKPG